MSEAGCYGDNGRDLYPPWPWDYLTHGEAITKRDELNARDGKQPGDSGGFVIIRASIFYRVTHGPSSLAITDPVSETNACYSVP